MLLHPAERSSASSSAESMSRASMAADLGPQSSGTRCRKHAGPRHCASTAGDRNIRPGVTACSACARPARRRHELGGFDAPLRREPTMMHRPLGQGDHLAIEGIDRDGIGDRQLGWPTRSRLAGPEPSRHASSGRSAGPINERQLVQHQERIAAHREHVGVERARIDAAGFCCAKMTWLGDSPCTRASRSASSVCRAGKRRSAARPRRSSCAPSRRGAPPPDRRRRAACGSPRLRRRSARRRAADRARTNASRRRRSPGARAP